MLIQVLFLITQATAAPFPATATSAMVSPKAGWFLARHGFRISTESTKWILDSKGSLEGDTAQFRLNSLTGTGSLLVKTEKLGAEMSVDNYARRWLKDYAHFGFTLMGSKPFAQGNAKGLVIDLFHPKEKKQTRQAVFLRGRKAVLMTCTDGVGSIKESLDSCNKIIKTFEWVE